MRLALALAVALVAPVAAVPASDPMTILGITISYPLNLPPCPGAIALPRLRLPAQCVERGTERQEGRAIAYRIGLADGQVPDFLSSRVLTVGVIDGRVEWLYAS